MALDRRSLLLALAGGVFLPSASWSADALAPFMLEDVNGSVVDDGTLLGRVTIVFFGYTSCPDVCPTAMMTVSKVLDALGPDSDKVLPLFISLDPQRDTRKQLSAYAANFDPRIVPLRGPEPYVAAAAKSFDVTFRRVDPDASNTEDYAIDHTALFFLVGPDGRIAARLAFSTPPEAMATRLKDLISALPPAQGN